MTVSAAGDAPRVRMKVPEAAGNDPKYGERVICEVY